MIRRVIAKAMGTSPNNLGKTAYLDMGEWMFVSFQQQNSETYPYSSRHKTTETHFWDISLADSFQLESFSYWVCVNLAQGSLHLTIKANWFVERQGKTYILP